MHFWEIGITPCKTLFYLMYPACVEKVEGIVDIVDIPQRINSTQVQITFQDVGDC